LQSYGTVITGRVDLVNVAFVDQTCQNNDAATAVEAALEWNFGCMDLNWLHRYCKTQVFESQQSSVVSIAITHLFVLGITAW
jgi:hypothetical protein